MTKHRGRDKEEETEGRMNSRRQKGTRRWERFKKERRRQ